MQFYNPEVLYALFLLIIPVIVHLFQLRKFQKEAFTNVKFLKKISRQTRKSSRLKKWLVLASRLLLLASIIFAFSRPYFPNSIEESGEVETFIYLDNSYSMQADGRRGRLLNRSVQELLENLPEGREFYVMTNNDAYPEVTRENLQNIEYSATPIEWRTVYLRAQNYFSNNPGTNKKLLLISDFQEQLTRPDDLLNNDVNLYALPLKPENNSNVSLDSVYLSSSNATSGRIRISLSYSGNNPGNVPVSLFSGERLLGKTSVDFTENQDELEFPIEEMDIAEGKVQIEDNGLAFDNVLFFSLNRINPIQVTAINGAEDDFLNRIFRSSEFDFASMPLNEIRYNSIAEAKVIILNEITDLPPSLLGTLQEKSGNNTIFIIVPPPGETGSTLRGFINSLGFTNFGELAEREKLVSQISFQHPLFSEVFEEQISNFEYPKVQSSYRVSTNLAPILSYQDNTPFLTETNGNFLFTAPLNKNNTNFTQSPLIVPVFYNMGISALQPAKLYYLLGETNKIEVPVDLQADRILSISSPTSSFIPQQQSFSGKVEILTQELPEQPGNYKILNGDREVLNISFNVPRKESNMQLQAITTIENIEPLESLEEFFSTPGFTEETDFLWKWFVIFALFFLVTETLLLKYLK